MQKPHLVVTRKGWIPRSRKGTDRPEDGVHGLVTGELVRAWGDFPITALFSLKQDITSTCSEEQGGATGAGRIDE